MLQKALDTLQHKRCFTQILVMGRVFFNALIGRGLPIPPAIISMEPLKAKHSILFHIHLRYKCIANVGDDIAAII
ncbi:MAG: hypothetical protein DSY83_15735 [Flavobacteriia bacterium]|nr:MAG: hypothetical protein DSY83_15735 [Flavobacteriia bacterium]